MQAYIASQRGFNMPDHLWGGACRSFLNIFLKIVAAGILILMPSADAGAEWKIMTWRPFPVKNEFVAQPGKGKVVMLRKALAGRSSDRGDAGAKRLQGNQQSWPDAQSFYVSELPARIWGSYLRRAGVYQVLVKSNMQAESLFVPELFRDTTTRDNLMAGFSDRTPATIREAGGAHYIRWSFFSREMQHLYRGSAERQASRNSPWETLLFPSSGERNQSVLETMGKIFEPKIDLGIEF